MLELRQIDASYDGNRVLTGLNLTLAGKRVLGLVGESGSGKSTVARVLTGLLRPDAGEVLFKGKPLAGRRTKEECRRIQMVFQNPEGSLNPRFKIGKILSEAMLFHGIADRRNVKEACQEWVEKMRLPADTLSRYPRSFSGGQKQRIALARALCVKPEILIADEPTSALDVTVQLQILKEMQELRRELDLTILFISHDLGVIHYFCDDIAVMRQGQIVETGSKEAFFAHPKTAYGQLLLAAVPRIG